MGMHYAPVDAGERELAAAQLEDMALAHEGRSWADWKSVVVEWHLQQVAHARAQAWVPGLAGTRDPAIEHALNRFYGHCARATIARLKAENNELRRRLLDSVSCARYYASGGADAGARADELLATLTTPLATEAAAQAKPVAGRARALLGKRGQRH